MFFVALFTFATIVAIVFANAVRKPTRAQPHVVLEGQHLNTFATPLFHQDTAHRSWGDDVAHQFIVQLKAPINESRHAIGTCRVCRLARFFALAVNSARCQQTFFVCCRIVCYLFHSLQWINVYQ